MPLTWNDETVEKLKTLWGEGLSASQIGRILDGSRNAIIGKVHRLKLNNLNAKQKIVRATLPRIEAPRKQINFTPNVVDLPEPEAIGPMNTFPLWPHKCLNINEHPSSEPWRCCGHEVLMRTNSSGLQPVIEHLPYCEYHWRKNHSYAPKHLPHVTKRDIEGEAMVSLDNWETDNRPTQYKNFGKAGVVRSFVKKQAA